MRLEREALFPLFDGEKEPELRVALNNLRADCQMTTLHEFLVALWHKEREPDPTYRCLALLALDSRSDGAFLTSNDVTGILTHLMRFIRLCTARKFVSLLQQHEHIINPQDRVDRLLVPILRFVREHNASTFAHLMSLQHFCTADAILTGGLPTTVWDYTCETLYFKGRPVTVPLLREILADVQREALAIFDELRAGVDIQFRLSAMRDDLTNTEVGYSAFSHAHSPYMADMLANFLGPWLAKIGIIVEGVIDGGRAAWFLNKLSELESLLMVMVQMGSGGPARGTELVHLTVKNIRTRQRGLYIVGDVLAIIRSYSKTTHQHHHDKVIPIALDAVTTFLLVSVHGCFRPPARLIASTARPESAADLTWLYSNMLFVGSKGIFDSADFSNVMGRVSLPRLGWSMKLSHYRQIYVAVNTLYRPQANMPGADHPLSALISPAVALQAGHTPGTEGRHYAVSAEATHGLSEFFMRILMNLSHEWATFMHLTPGYVSDRSPRLLTTAHFQQLLDCGVIRPALGVKPLQQTSDRSALQDILTAIGAVSRRLDALESRISSAGRHNAGDRESEGMASVSFVPPLPSSPSYSCRSRSTQNQVAADDDVFFDGSEKWRHRTASVSGAQQSVSTATLDNGEDTDDEYQVREDRMGTSAIDQLDGELGMPDREGERIKRRACETSPPARRLATTLSVPRIYPANVRADMSKPPVQDPSTSKALCARPVLLFNEGLMDCLPPPYKTRASIPRRDLIHQVGTLLRDSRPRWASDGQRLAVEAMLEGDEDLIVALPTSTGKTLMAILPSTVELGITVVVVPLNSLLAQWDAELTVWGVEHCVFQGSEDPLLASSWRETPRGLPRVLLVSVDKAVDRHWPRALNCIRATGAFVQRVILDEAHFALTHQNFRPVFDDLMASRLAPCPWVLMSATIPPSMVPLLVARFGLQNVRIIRDLSDRPELQYRVEGPWRGLPEDGLRLTQFVKNWEESSVSDEERLMIFVQSIPEGHDVSALTGFPFFFSGERQEDADEDSRWGLSAKTKDQIWSNFVEGANGVRGLITTTALSAGNNCRAVTGVLHLGPKAFAAEYCQEAGRGGRDGRACICTMWPYRKPRPLASSLTADQIAYGDVRGMDHYTHGLPKLSLSDPERCRRHALLVLIDGKGLSCVQIVSARLCDLCEQAQRAGIDLSLRHGKALLRVAPNKRPPVRPLVPKESPVDWRLVERKLRTEFGTSYNEGQQRLLQRLAERSSRAKDTRGMLEMLREICGYCWI
ncbi:hypothetical protein GGF50DRAFT_60007, partial [Schizophyllum commune]